MAKLTDEEWRELTKLERDIRNLDQALAWKIRQDEIKAGWDLAAEEVRKQKGQKG